MKKAIAGKPGHHRSDRGFILALGMLLLAAMALIGTAALTTSSFQKDLANNTRIGSEVYYVANMAIAQGIRQLNRMPPRSNEMTKFQPPLYLGGYYNKTTRAVQLYSVDDLSLSDPSGCLTGTPGPDGFTPDHNCLCGGTVTAICVDFYVELSLQNLGNAPPRYGIGQFKTYYYKLKATATGFQGNASTVSIYSAAVYPAQYGFGGTGGGS